MIHLRTMTLDDVPLGMRLKDQAGWNQTEADWRRFLDLEPTGCFVAERQGRPVGTTTTCVFESVGWIAMVLVEESARHQGIGSHLVRHALEYLDRRGVRTARLDATALGRPVYERLGFRAEYDLVRLEGTIMRESQEIARHVSEASHTARNDEHTDPGETVAPVTSQTLDALIELDHRVTGTLRSKLIERLYRERSEAAGAVVHARGIVGHIMFRDGSRAVQIGPAAATGPAAGRALGDWALRQCAGRQAFVDVPCDNREAIGWADAQGLVVQRQFTRMVRGQALHDHPAHIWASSGPEKG